MAWIESHQSVWEHAKTRKAAKRLAISPVLLVGHLHALWHWAVDHAEDGNVSKYDAEDLAIAARWDGDAEEFVATLTGCGPGDSAGFLERGGSYGDPEHALTGDLVLHDWWRYAGKLIARRKHDRARSSARRSQDVPTTVVGPPSDGPTADGPPSSPPITPPLTPSSQPTNQPSALADKPPKRKSQIPQDWQPTDMHRDLAAEMGVSLEVEAEQFADHHRARGSTFKDWDAAFRTWLRNARKFREERGGIVAPPPAPVVDADGTFRGAM